MKPIHALITALMILGCMTTQSHSAEDALPVAPPYVIQAHRGYSSEYPENTMLAFREAVEAGANRIETDLWISADGIPILLHDRTVDRTTDGTGNADALTIEQIQALDAGSWKNKKFAGARIPTLNDALDFIVKQNGVELNLEIKWRKTAEEKMNSAIDASVTLVKEKSAEASIVFSSFHMDALLQVRRRLPNARLILLCWNKNVASRGLYMARKHKLYGLSPHYKYLSANLVHDAKQAGIAVFVKGEDQQQMREAQRWGVTGFANNDPLLLKTWLGNDREKPIQVAPRQSTDAQTSEQ